MPGKITIDRADSVSELATGWTVQLDAMPHSPLQSSGSTGEVSFSTPTTPQVPFVMYNSARFDYYFPNDFTEIEIASTIPLPPPIILPPTSGGGWGEGNWGDDGGWGGSPGTGSGWGTEAWGSDPWGA